MIVIDVLLSTVKWVFQAGYQLPLYLWQELHEEAGRRKRLGLPLGTQNAIACAALAEWLQSNKGGDE